VLLVSIDALRADALEPRRTKKGRRFAKPGDTPVLDELEDHCFRFRHVYSQSSSTHYSMPTMFRSTHAFEGDRVGRPLPVVMAELGLYPIALANNFFLEPRFEATARMLDGFERVSIYEMREMNEAVPLASELLEAVRDRRFFFWFHFYNMHLPGYAGRTLTRKDGRWPKRYRMALKWVDGQMGELLARLDALGLAERTLLVVASDHGEALGDNNRSSHGSTLYEEEVRVPLYLRVPGVEGRIVEEVVGNIDLVPTLLELLGAPPDPLMRGRSLVPLMVGDAARQTPDYYLKSHRRKFYGVVHGTDKLLWARKSGAWLRFDVAQDPTEDVNLFTSDGYMDLEMSRRLLRLHPGLLRAELKDPETLDVLRRRMEEAGASTPPAALDLLLRVAALSHDKALIRHGRRLFREAADDRARLLVLRRLYELDRAGLKPVLAERLDAVAGTREELELVSGLAAQRQPALPTKQTAARMRRWLDDRAGWLPWLTLTRPWTRKRPAQYAPVYADMLERLEPDAPEARLLLLGVASMRRAKGEAARRLAAGIGGWLEHPSSAVRAAACRALGSVGDEQAVPLLMGRLEQGRPRERQAVAYALGRIQGGAAVPLLTRLKDDPLLVLDVANVLGSLDTPKAIPPLEDIAKKFYNPNVRSRAAVALKGLRKRVEKKARKRRGKRKGKGKGAPPSAP